MKLDALAEKFRKETPSVTPAMEKDLVAFAHQVLEAAAAPSFCTKHDREKICPSCVGAKGGKKTARKHGDKLSTWGKQGGRPTGEVSG